MKVFSWYSVVMLLFVMGLVSCNSGGGKKSQSIEDRLEVELDTTSQVIKFENTLFSIPSPYQLSLLVKEVGVDYNAELLNPSSNYSQYTSLFKKSVNLGIYGADLAYLNTYEQSPAAIKYFSVIKIISQDLGLSAALSPNIFERIEANVSNQDSLLFIMSNTYRDVDFFLKENQRQREGALVLAGGWIEAMYFLSKLATETKNFDLIQRIGENKQPLESLIKVLSPYYSESEEVAKLVDDLIDLAYEFDGIETEYTYVEPEVIPSEKLTKVKSISKIKVPVEVMASIDEKISSIRAMLIL